jgi:putative transposase
MNIKKYKSNRLPFKELYKNINEYFVTICVKNRQNIFSNIDQGVSNLTPIGEIAFEEWNKIPILYYGVSLREVVFMPNHIHGIINFDRSVNTSLSLIIAGFKSITYKRIKSFVEESPAFHKKPDLISSKKIKNKFSLKSEYELLSNVGQLITNNNTIWQKSYYDHILRNEEDRMRIQEYILMNPLSWQIDELNPDNVNYKKMAS